MDTIDKIASLLELIDNKTLQIEDVLVFAEEPTFQDFEFINFNDDSELFEACSTVDLEENKESVVQVKVARSRKREQSMRCRIDAAKRARDRGEAYETPSGKLMPPREQRAPCTEGCRLKCTKRITEEERTEVFREFWSIADHTAQWDFIARNIKVSPKEKCTTVRGESRRSKTRTYFFHISGKLEQVCKTMFLNTLGISNAWVATVCKKLSVNGYVSTDGRGKIGHRRKKIDQLISNTVIGVRSD